MPNFRFMLYSPEEEEPNGFLRIELFKISLDIKLYPWLIRPHIRYRYSKEYNRMFRETIPKQFGLAYLPADNYYLMKK